MSDENSEYPTLNSKLPDFGTVLQQRVMARNNAASPTPIPAGAVDPFKVMLDKKNQETAPIDPATIKQWNPDDVQKLEDYCKKIGVVGFNSGRMHPIAALSMLKQQFGDMSDVPIEERVPSGYEKMGTKSKYNANYPYSEAMKKQQIILG